MATVTDPAPLHDLESLDRGVREVGLTAAEAVARVEMAETRLAALEARDGCPQCAAVERALRYVLKLAGHEDWETVGLTA